ncbi:hypothetical protein VIGAN_06034300, partial [Vigna angularis var. angularis]
DFSSPPNPSIRAPPSPAIRVAASTVVQPRRRPLPFHGAPPYFSHLHDAASICISHSLHFDFLRLHSRERDLLIASLS